MRKRRAIFGIGVVCAVVLGVTSSSASALGPDSLRAPSLPLVEVIGCKLGSGGLVCKRDGKLLPNRLGRSKVKEPKKEAQPVPKKTQSKKIPAVRNRNTATQQLPSEDDGTPAEATATRSDEGELEGAEETPCPPGYVALEEPDASGSHCASPSNETTVESEEVSPAEPADGADPNFTFQTLVPPSKDSASPPLPPGPESSPSTAAPQMSAADQTPGEKAATGAGPTTKSAEPPSNTPQAVAVARTTTVPNCTLFVDAAAPGEGKGTAEDPFKTIAAAVEGAKPGAVICVAEGTYAEEIKPGERAFTLAGGFQSGKDFKIRDSAAFASHAKGNGGSFIRIEDPAPKGDALTVIDGFEISGYAQAVVRDFWESQRFDVTNNFIHDNTCADQSLAGAGLSLVNISGTIKGNVFQNNSCGRGGAIFLNDPLNENKVSIENNLIDGNEGTEPDSAHGGGVYLFGNTLDIVANTFTNNRVTKWGGGLYVGAYTEGNQPTTATLAWNVYRGNRAGDSGGGFFCDDGATCEAEHEVYVANCGGNILLDGGSGGSGPTIAKFDHITNYEARDRECQAPGHGVLVGNYEGGAADSYSFTNSIFWGNGAARDFGVACVGGCEVIKVAVASSMVQTKYEDGSIAIKFGEGNVEPADPLFVDAANGNLHLKPGSPASGKGSNGTDLGTYSGSGGTAVAERAAAEKSTPNPPSAPAEPEAAKTEPEPEAANAPAQENTSKKSGTDAADISAKRAFDDAKELGTAEAWNAFLANYPDGFYADLARAYLKKLGGTTTAPPAAEAPAPAAPAAGPAPAAPAKPLAEGGATADGSVEKATGPAIARGRDFMGFPEKFNRYYTDPSWKPLKTLYVSPTGEGDGTTRETPMAVAAAMAAAQPGTEIYFLRGKYTGCFELTKENSGTYDQPIVLYAERNEDGSIGVSVACCSERRKTCFNFEDADYIAVDGFELIGGQYGVRAVGRGFAASEHSRGIAVLRCDGHDQDRDPFKSSQSDWNVWESNVAYGAKEGDGHGIYISGGSDWNIVRFNETYGNVSSDFQINADPASACGEDGIAFDDPQCDAYAGEGEGGRGASDYFLVDGNYFHDSLGPGPNFTSVRRSIIRNNIFGPQARHNVSFWQETDNPKLGSSDNKILHNLFITTDRHAVQFVNNSTRNLFANNVILGVELHDGKAGPNPSALLMEADDTGAENVYASNLYISGKVVGRELNDQEKALTDFSADWFVNFPTELNHDPNAFTPTPNAPFLALGAFSSDAPFDRNGVMRRKQVDLGPIETP